MLILVDGGSTHNFIQGFVPERLGIGVESLEAFHIFIGRGEYLLSCEVCHQIAVSMQEYVIIQDLYLLPMEGANVVLGVQWLEMLGTMKTNYKQRFIEFKQEGKTIHLKEDYQLAETTISGSSLHRFMAKN